MVSSHISMSDSLIRAAFHRFDVDNTGYITVENLKDVLGESYYGTHVEHLLDEADFDHDGFISLEEFVAYLKGQPVHVEVAEDIVERSKTNEGGNSTPLSKPTYAWSGDTG